MLTKYLIMDVDGTLTDGKIYMGSNGEMFKVFNIKDGYGIRNIAIPAGIVPVIITARESKMVSNRCRELLITHVYQGVSDKKAKLCEIVSDLSEVAYIGDDENDIPVMLDVKDAGGIVGCPKNAIKKVLDLADYIAEHNAGDGAVRDFIEWIVEKHKN